MGLPAVPGEIFFSRDCFCVDISHSEFHGIPPPPPPPPVLPTKEKAMSDADDFFTWAITRKKQCFKLFVKLKCVKSGHEGLNWDADDFDITQLDEKKMKTHILDCVAALGMIQQRLSHKQSSLRREGEQSLTEETQAVSNKVFKASLLTMATAMIHDGTDVSKQSESVDMLLRAFPDESKQMDGRNWLPLHWAVALEEQCVTEEDVNVIYTGDPMALQRKHLYCACGYTPAHVLCMQEITQRSMSLIKHFSVCNSGAFITSADYPYGFSALHAACCYGQPTEELLKHLLQLDSSQTKKMSFGSSTPLSNLCANSNCSDSLVTCLLEVDSSTEVVANGIVGCVESTDYSCMLARVEMLLNANPEAAKYRQSNNQNLLHIAAKCRKMPPQLCIDIMQRIHAIHQDAVREVDRDGWLPVHYAARDSTVEVMEFLLGLYPESASVVTSDGSHNLLHLAVYDNVRTTSVMETKVRFLCSRYPAMILQRSDNDGFTPLHYKIIYRDFPAVQILCEAGGQEQVRLPVGHATRANSPYNDWLPLHYLIHWNAESLRNSLFSKEADYFRMLLRWYPEAVGMEGGVFDADVDEEEDDDEDEDEEFSVYRKTPYQLAVYKNLPHYYLRLLLRAAPDLNPAELHRLNYAERRMAMFLAFKAVTSQKKPVVLKRLCFENKDLVKHVMSFL